MTQDSRTELFSRLFNNHRRLIAWILNRHLRMIGLSADVPDHVQEIFVKGLASFQPENGEQKSLAWLSRMTTNHAIDQLRKHAARAKCLSDEDAQPLMGLVASKADSPEDALIGSETSKLHHDRLMAAYARLPDAQREALRLRFFEGLRYPDIARRLDIALDTAKSRVRYALSKLRRHLEEADASPDLPARGSQAA